MKLINANVTATNHYYDGCERDVSSIGGPGDAGDAGDRNNQSSSNTTTNSSEPDDNAAAERLDSTVEVRPITIRKTPKFPSRERHLAIRRKKSSPSNAAVVSDHHDHHDQASGQCEAALL